MISQLIGDSWKNETGYGLFADAIGGEESYEHTVIDLDNKLVIVDNKSHSFEEFIEYQLETEGVSK
jgi:hypothetical protein